MDKRENVATVHTHTHTYFTPIQIKNGKFLLLIITVALTIFVSVIKYRGGEINYYNADATWHTLLTIQAYDETHISKHLFLPIVSLGDETDKNIKWGDTLADEDGNYYYTSFSPAGYFAPWLFFKTFHLPVTEKSLYIFNTLLFIASAILLVEIIDFLYSKHKYAHFFALIALLVYICAPEILHGMGIVYWHQSIFQVTFLIQLYTYLLFKRNNNKIAKYIFYITTLINPYIEWTGYIANIGFALIEFITYWQKNRKEAVRKALLIILLTLCSLALFCFHYLLILDAKSFFQVVKRRFLVRGITQKVSINSLIMGYITSFKYLWPLLILYIIWNFTKSKKLSIENRTVIFLCCFPLLENFIMEQHTIIYSYDRMKLIFPLTLLICEIIRNIIENTKLKKITLSAIFIITFIISAINIKSYINNTSYIWKINYRESNEKFASYINENYKNSLLALEKINVRGYINLLFGRGIYENATYESVKDIAIKNNQKYIVLLSCEYNGTWNTYKLKGATIYNLENNTIEKITVQDGKIYSNDTEILT